MNSQTDILVTVEGGVVQDVTVSRRLAEALRREPVVTLIDWDVLDGDSVPRPEEFDVVGNYGAQLSDAPDAGYAQGLADVQAKHEQARAPSVR